MRPATDVSDVIEVLRMLEESGMAGVASGRQLSIRPKVAVGREQLQDLVVSLTRGLPGVLVASSAHSIDVTDARPGKTAVLAEFQKRHGPVFAIGDQGDVGGNDFGLLSATALSISVDECSSDPTRCWNITNSATTGPDALAVALRSVSVRRGRTSFRLTPVSESR